MVCWSVNWAPTMYYYVADLVPDLTEFIKHNSFGRDSQKQETKTLNPDLTFWPTHFKHSY